MNMASEEVVEVSLTSVDGTAERNCTLTVMLYLSLPVPCRTMIES